MTERQTLPSDPHELLQRKEDLSARFEQFPPEHQASLALALVGKVAQGEWGTWLKEALALRLEREASPATVQQRLLEQWRALTPDEQAALLVEQLRDVLASETGAVIQEAIQAKPSEPDANEFPTPAGLTLAITLERDDLREANLTEEEIAQLTDDDLDEIARRMERHYRLDAFWQELEYTVTQLLEEKTP